MKRYFEFKIGDNLYQIKDRFTGKNSTVYICRLKGSEEIFVVKKFASQFFLSDKSNQAFLGDFYAHLAEIGISSEIVIEHDSEEKVYALRTFETGDFYSHKIPVHRKKNLNLQYSMKIVKAMLDQLSVVHRSGIIHRDIKPANILIKNIDEEVDLSIIDFDSSQWNSRNIHFHKRVPFSLIYSSPEQLMNHADLVSSASDVFSAGMVLYELCSKKLPFNQSNPEVIMNLQLHYPLSFSSRIPTRLQEIITKATYREVFPRSPRKMKHNEIAELLQKGIEQRYQNCDEFKNDLQEFIERGEKVKEYWFF